MIPFLIKIFGLEDIFDRPLACPICGRWLREIPGAPGHQVKVCPKWHSSVIQVSAMDVRASAVLQNAAPNARAIRSWELKNERS